MEHIYCNLEVDAIHYLLEIMSTRAIEAMKTGQRGDEIEWKTCICGPGGVPVELSGFHCQAT